MLVHFIIFIIILFFYLHITDQYKKGEDLEVYEMDYVDNAQLQEVCNIKQPIVFDSPANAGSFFQKMRDNMDGHYGAYEVQVKDTVDYANATGETNSVDSIGLPMQSAQNLFITDTQSHYFSEGNATFLEETGMVNYYRSIDTYLKPQFMISSNEDLWFGSKNTATPLRYHTYYRRFLYVISGKVHLKVSPWKSSKFLKPIKDYEDYDFRSTYNPWANDSVDTPLQFLEAEACAGQIIYLPPYWWYSIRFVADEPTYVCCETYHSPMNIIAHTSDLFFYFLQNQNIRTVYRKTLPINEPTQKMEAIPKNSELPVSEKDATLQLTQNLSID